ncbi:hypothetical protein TSTA_017330 [Talaromyces stipitatus ATCC 10500]|uniref:Uncharacterized protein n=1 Tax=Talaromyces stipitatus (strain ATCC 10500 / CBS 375.48 / QM 6759 / NRRL 1006) TaxID=441959 RepID=B8MFC4_TALSN|nr:uncharacterized protein TSTA_017330 [Talaromyces stipitatus ATCC 10500]EED16658.1 hypothetical protein TSTA_017330 [Talaromyces stipitatus ATCC 10500]
MPMPLFTPFRPVHQRSRYAESPEELPSASAGSHITTISDPTPITLGLQEEQSPSPPRLPLHPDRHDTDPSTSWLSVFDDYTNNEITPPFVTDYGPILHPTRPETILPIDPAILGDETPCALTHDWQDSGDSGFVSFDELSQESDSIRDHFASTPDPQPGQQSTRLGALPSYDRLDQQTHLSGAHITEAETATAPALQSTGGGSSQEFNKRRSTPEYDSEQPSKRVCPRTAPSENVNPPLLPTLCSHFLTAPKDV